MIFQRAKCKPVDSPKAEKIAFELARTRSSFAILTADDGAYIQVAGGPGLFLLEHRNAQGQHYRAFQDQAVVPFPDGTTIESSAGRIPMAQADWFLLKQVNEVFAAYLASERWPDYVHWKKLTPAFAKAG